MAEKPAKPTLVVDKPRGKPRELRPGPKGGMLMVGGTNKGGPGRPPSVVREMCLGSFADRLDILQQIADGLIECSAGDRIKAIDTLAKYGLGTKTETEHSGGAVFEMVVRHEVPTRRIS